MMHYELLRYLLDRVTFEDYKFDVGQDGATLWFRVRYLEPDVDGDAGNAEIQLGRRWLVERESTPSDVVRSAFKAVMTSMEHRAREHFLYRGERVFGPHCDVEELVALCKRGDR